MSDPQNDELLSTVDGPEMAKWLRVMAGEILHENFATTELDRKILSLGLAQAADLLSQPEPEGGLVEAATAEGLVDGYIEQAAEYPILARKALIKSIRDILASRPSPSGELPPLESDLHQTIDRLTEELRVTNSALMGEEIKRERAEAQLATLSQLADGMARDIENHKLLNVVSADRYRAASRPSVSGEVEELMEEMKGLLEEMKGLQKIAAGYYAKLCEQQAQLATLRQLAEAMAISVEVDCLSEPETRIAVHNYRAAFPTPTAEEKENG